MALVSPQQVSDGTSIVASNVNNPINTIANDYNGNITDANISASAAISGSKIATASVPTTSLINDWQTNYVVSGGVIAISSGLIGTFSNLTVVIDGYKMTLSSVPNKTYTASKDTYVDILRTGTTPSIVYTEVANNAASPALASSSIRVGIVVTSGAAITIINQGASNTTGPTVSSNVLTVSDSLGNLICNREPVPTTFGYAEVVAGQGGITTIADITGMSTTIIAPANCYHVWLEAEATVSSASANITATLSITDGSNNLQVDRTTIITSANAAALQTVNVRRRVEVAPLSTNTFKLRATGTGTLIINNGSAAGQPSVLSVRRG